MTAGGYHHRRWLLNDDVTDISVNEQGIISVQTPAGVSRLVPYYRSLDKKINAIEEMIRKHHVREGSDHQHRGQQTQYCPATFSPTTTMTVSDQHVRGGRGVLALGLPAKRRPGPMPGNRSRAPHVSRAGDEYSRLSPAVFRAQAPKPKGGEWYESKDGKWWWKGDTSSDEVVGHYFAYAIYFDIAADVDQKEAIRKVVARITDHIIDHGYYYVGPPGKPTTWGVWAPEKLNRDFRRVGDRGLNSLEILSFLKVAHHITGNAKYEAAAKELIDKHGYAANTILEKTIWPPTVNHSDDELGFLSYYPLLWYERDTDLRCYYLASIERARAHRAPESARYSILSTPRPPG